MGPALEGLSSLGTKYVAIPAIQNPDDRSDFNKLADEFNGFGEQMAKHGLTFVYHNHGYEHAPKDGKTLMDTLLTQTDAKNVKFELDIFWDDGSRQQILLNILTNILEDLNYCI